MRRNYQTVGMVLMENPAQFAPLIQPEDSRWRKQILRMPEGKERAGKGLEHVPMPGSSSVHDCSNPGTSHHLRQCSLPCQDGNLDQRFSSHFHPFQNSQSSQALASLSFPMCGCVGPITALTSFPHLKYCTGGAEPWKTQCPGMVFLHFSNFSCSSFTLKPFHVHWVQLIPPCFSLLHFGEDLNIPDSLCILWGWAGIFQAPEVLRVRFLGWNEVWEPH